MGSRLEHDDPARRDEGGDAGSRIAAGAGVLATDTEDAELAQPHVLSARQRAEDFLEDAIDQGAGVLAGKAGEAGVNGVREVVARQCAFGNSRVQNPMRLFAASSKSRRGGGRDEKSNLNAPSRAQLWKRLRPRAPKALATASQV